VTLVWLTPSGELFTSSDIECDNGGVREVYEEVAGFYIAIRDALERAGYECLGPL
jgi:hypothetical protein